jgi:cytoskeletal protein CcmA (bactofilin family)
MWRKTDEARPSSTASEAPTPAAINSNTTTHSGSTAPALRTPLNAPGIGVTPSGVSKIIPGLKIEGEISGTADLYIDGEVQGVVRLGGAKVTVGPNGRVQANIEARAISVEGNVRGNLRASEGIFLGARSRSQGSLTAPRLGIEEGARLSGKVDMKRPSESHSETGGGKQAESVTIRRVAVGASEKPEEE